VVFVWGRHRHSGTLCIQLFQSHTVRGGVPAGFHHPLLHLKMSGRSMSPGKAASPYGKKARFEGGGGASSSAAASYAPPPAAPASDEEGEGDSIYVSASEEEEGGGGSGTRRRHALLAGRRKATPAEIEARKRAARACFAPHFAPLFAPQSPPLTTRAPNPLHRRRRAGKQDGRREGRQEGAQSARGLCDPEPGLCGRQYRVRAEHHRGH